ncbi:MAG: hypothetical protein VX498_05990 [Myxococcota bacterium]|nr:hypothetical protein [Myxococcota bacterium]
MRRWCLFAVLLGLAGCAGSNCGDEVAPVVESVDDADVVYATPPPNSPGTLRGLGPHLWEATLDKRGDSAGIHGSRSATSRLVWAELDYYEFQEFGPDTLRFEEIRLGNNLFRRNSSEADYQQVRGTPGDAIILQRTLGAWKEVLSPFAQQAAFERQQDTTIDGRAVRVYRLRLAPPVAPSSDRTLSLEHAANLSGMAVTPIELSGRIYVDIETGNRLLAELEGRYVPRRVMGNTDPTDEVYVVYRESRSPTQLAPTIRAPDPSKVRKKTRVLGRPLGPVTNPRP